MVLNPNRALAGGAFLIACSLAFASCEIALANPLQRQSVATTATANDASALHATLHDFEWLAGRWTGTSDGHPTEEICSRAGAGLMVCVFRVVDENPQLLEVSTLHEIENGIEERVRYFAPTLESWEGAAPLVLRLQSLSDVESVFVNVNEKSVARRVVITRNTADTMTSRVEVVTAQGKVVYLEAKSTRER